MINKTAHRLQHIQALDGIRAIAVMSVILYHAGISWAGGGFLGVEIFFVLSGFLITSLLVAEIRDTAKVNLGAFWGRRARRLLPALFCMVAVVGIYQTLSGAARAYPQLLQAGLATIFYVGNWQQILSGNSYFAASGPVSPLQHTWSLAIEEQFYIVWPLFIVVAIWGYKRLKRARLHTSPIAFRFLFVCACVGAATSAGEMALLFRNGLNENRVYLGTDTRAQGLLVGSALALGLAIFRSRKARYADRHIHLAKDVSMRYMIIGFVGLLTIIAIMYFAQNNPNWLYSFGFLATDLATMLVIASIARAPSSLLARFLALPPLSFIGTISYGLYIWHFPLFQWLEKSTIGVSGVELFAIRIAACFSVALVSFYCVEQPIRQRRLPQWLVVRLVPLGGLSATFMLLAASSVPVIVAEPPIPKATTWVGTQPPCSVSLRDTSTVIEVPPRPASIPQDNVLAASGYRGAATMSFRTCPPVRVLVIGDSLADTLGVGLLQNEQLYGTQIFVAPSLGCGFIDTGEIYVNTGWAAQPSQCPGAFSMWQAEVAAIHPQAIIVDLGWRDCFDHLIGNSVEHLGQSAYDNYLQSRMHLLAHMLGSGGAPILFTSVAWANPPADADGSLPDYASATRHTEINEYLKALVRSNPHQYSLFNLDSYISPGNAYAEFLNGHQCRFSDGVHYTLYCATLLQPYMLSEVRRLVGSPSLSDPSQSDASQLP